MVVDEGRGIRSPREINDMRAECEQALCVVLVNSVEVAPILGGCAPAPMHLPPVALYRCVVVRGGCVAGLRLIETWQARPRFDRSDV